MKRIRYGVAMTLDGFIAGPNGEADWIVMDPEVNFAEIWAQFDTLLMGRRTYQAGLAFDIFINFLQSTKPAFATFFTNHVASSMHRFWAAAGLNGSARTDRGTERGFGSRTKPAPGRSVRTCVDS